MNNRRVFHRDRNIHGGGGRCLIAVSDSLKPKLDNLASLGKKLRYIQTPSYVAMTTLMLVYKIQPRLITFLKH